MHFSPSSLLVPATVAMLMLALSGCASSKYQTVNAGPRLPRSLDLSGRNLSTEVKVNTVIIRGGPGSWKHDAWWDEYVVSLTNHGRSALTVDGAKLTSAKEKVTVPGDDPWRLERESKTIWAHVGTSGGVTSSALITMGGVVVEAVTLGGIKALDLAGTATDHILTADARNAAGIEAEFSRRRLALPFRLAPGETRTGSLFFPVSPGPKRLELQCSSAAQLSVVAVDLSAISHLHLGRDPAAEPEPVGVPLASLSPPSTIR